MKAKPKDSDVGEITASWTLPSAARLGSSIRSKGLFLEVRARLPVAARKWLSVKAGELALSVPQDATADVSKLSATIAKTLDGIESLPVIPREIEDILAISTTERHRWLKDGRLPSAGTRTVRLRGRAKAITFHVFDPRIVEDILNENRVETWREDDAVRAAENRRRAVWKAKLTRSKKTPGDTAAAAAEEGEVSSPNLLQGWAEFERDGLLR
ncbi:MAG: hypothetical protein EON48_19575 [Acetobacteraceae bacterium]|nr:MAG: hypothetical protein EON48_19575 [Acetobacteraceae bacterium]